MAEKKEKEEKVQLGPTLREGEIAIGVSARYAAGFLFDSDDVPRNEV